MNLWFSWATRKESHHRLRLKHAKLALSISNRPKNSRRQADRCPLEHSRGSRGFPPSIAIYQPINLGACINWFLNCSLPSADGLGHPMRPPLLGVCIHHPCARSTRSTWQKWSSGRYACWMGTCTQEIRSRTRRMQFVMHASRYRKICKFVSLSKIWWYL